MSEYIILLCDIIVKFISLLDAIPSGVEKDASLSVTVPLLPLRSEVVTVVLAMCT